MWKRRDCAGILQLLNYNLVTRVDHAGHHLPDLPSAPSPDPVLSHSHSLLPSSVKDPWPRLLFGKRPIVLLLRVASSYENELQAVPGALHMNPIDTSYMDPTGATRAAQRRLAGTLARRACAALAEVLASGSSVGASLKPGQGCRFQLQIHSNGKHNKRNKGDRPLRITIVQGKRRAWRELIAFHCNIF